LDVLHFSPNNLATHEEKVKVNINLLKHGMTNLEKRNNIRANK